MTIQDAKIQHIATSLIFSLKRLVDHCLQPLKPFKAFHPTSHLFIREDKKNGKDLRICNFQDFWVIVGGNLTNRPGRGNSSLTALTREWKACKPHIPFSIVLKKPCRLHPNACEDPLESSHAYIKTSTEGIILQRKDADLKSLLPCLIPGNRYTAPRAL
jgi:hypothetical protein